MNIGVVFQGPKVSKRFPLLVRVNGLVIGGAYTEKKANDLAIGFCLEAKVDPNTAVIDTVPNE